MKAIVLWLLVMLLGIAPAANGGGAELLYRYMSDNTLIVSGSGSSGEDLVVNGENPWVSKVFEAEDIWPGDSGEAMVELQNIGDPGTLQLHLLNLVDEPGITPEPEPAPDGGEFSQNLDILIWFDDGDNLYESGEAKIAEGKLKDIACNIYDLGILGTNSTIPIGMAWSVDGSVGNEIMGDECTFDIQFVLY